MLPNQKPKKSISFKEEARGREFNGKQPVVMLKEKPSSSVFEKIFRSKDAARVQKQSFTDILKPAAAAPVTSHHQCAAVTIEPLLSTMKSIHRILANASSALFHSNFADYEIFGNLLLDQMSDFGPCYLERHQLNGELTQIQYQLAQAPGFNHSKPAAERTLVIRQIASDIYRQLSFLVNDPYMIINPRDALVKQYVAFVQWKILEPLKSLALQK